MANSLFSSPNFIATDHNFPMSSNDSLDYVVSKQSLITLLNNTAAQIHYPMTIYQWDTNLPRIDSTLSTINLRPSCENFRRAAGTSHCEKCDKEYSNLFQGLTDIDLVVNIMERIRAFDFPKTINDYYESSYPKFITVNENYGYLEYNCPIMGYRELIFPIIFEHKIIGVVFIGQIRLNEPQNEKTIEEAIQHGFFNRSSQLFDKYIKLAKIDGNFLTQADIVNELIARQSKDRNMLKNYLELPDELIGFDLPDFLSCCEYKQLVEKILGVISDLQNQIKDNMKKKRESFIRLAIDESCKYFFSENDHNDLDAEESIPSQILGAFWDVVQKSMKITLARFDLHYIALFGINTIDVVETNRLNLVAFVPQNRDNPPLIDFQVAFDTYFDILKLDKHRMKQAISSLEYPELFNALSTQGKLFQKEHKLLLLFPVADKMQYSTAMLVSYSNETEFEYKEILDDLKTNLITGGTAIFSTLVSLLSRLSEASTNRMLRIYRHEISHVTMGLQHIHDYRLRNVDYIRKLTDEKLASIKMDYGSALAQLRGLGNNVQVLFGASHELMNTETDDVKIFKELIYKWRELYSKQIKGKILSFLTPRVFLSDEKRAPYVVDILLLDQIIYNLVDNAIKYSYWGTNVHIDCARPESTHDSRILSITSFGIEMENNDNPFKLFSRGLRSDDPVAGGAGIGLYIVKEMARQLGGSIQHQSIQISPLNIPLLDVYINRQMRQQKDSNILVLAKKELQRLLNTKYIDDQLMTIEKLRCINSLFEDTVSRKPTFYRGRDNDFEKSIRYYDNRHLYDRLPEKRIIAQICKPTFKTTFEVSI